MKAVNITSLRAKMKYYFDLISKSMETIIVPRNDNDEEAVVIMSVREYNALQKELKALYEERARSHTAFGESDFWALIDLLDWSKGQDNSEVIAFSRSTTKPLTQQITNPPTQQLKLRIPRRTWEANDIANVTHTRYELHHAFEAESKTSVWRSTELA